MYSTQAIGIAEETIAQVWDDMQPLLRAHWQEIATYPDITLNVNKAYYQMLQDARQLCIIVARNSERQLIGYAVFFVAHNTHYADSLQAKQDVFYVEKSARGAMVGLKLIAASDAILAARGVQAVYHHVKCDHPTLGALLSRKGYDLVEQMFAKRLDRE